MATKNIGKLAVQLTADARPLQQAAAQAKLTLDQFNKQAVAAAQKAAGLSRAMVGLALGAGGAVLAAAPVVFLKRMAEAMEAADRQARRLGVSIGELRGLHLAGGAAAEDFAQAVGQLNMSLAKAAAGDLKSQSMFKGIGGVDGLTGGPESLAAILDRLAAIPDATQRAAQAFRVLGEGAGELLPFLAEGGGGVRAAQDQARRMGLFVGENDVRSAREVARIFRDIDALVQGVKNQLFLAMAPIVAEIRSRLDFSSIDISGWRDAILDALEQAAMWSARIIDTLTDGTAWGALKAHAREFAAILLDAAAAVVAAVPGRGTAAGGAGLLKMLGAFFPVANVAGDVAAGAVGGNALADRAAALRAANAAGAASPWGTWLEGLIPGRAEQFMMDFAGGVRRRAGGNDQGFRLPGLGGVGDLGKALAGAPAGFFRQLNERFNDSPLKQADPLKQMQQDINDMRLFNAAGMFMGAKPGAQERMGFGILERLRAGVGMPGGPQFAGAAEERSAEAYSAIIRHQDPQRRESIQEEIKRLQEEAQRQREEQIRIGRETQQAIERQGGKVVGL